MTIQNTTIRKAGPSLGNGVTTVFPFTFKVFLASEILVTYLDSSAVESVLVLTTNYTVTLNSDQNASPGGSVTLLVAPASSTYITLTSQVANTQTLALTNSGGFYPESINNALDRTVIQVQQIAEKMTRTVSLRVSNTADPVTLSDKIEVCANNLASIVTNAANIGAINANVTNIVAIQNAVTSAATATTQANTATTQAGIATTQAGISTSQATTATTAATTATTQAATATTQAATATTQATNAAASAATATTQAATATTQATNAAASAATATTQAATATTQAGIATTGATTATTGATTATAQATIATTGATTATAQADIATTQATNAAASAASAAGYVVPSQTGNAGKYLGTNGTATSWAAVDALPVQTGNTGKYLTTSGTAASWATLNVDPNVTTKGLYEHSKTISANYTIGTGNNASSIGPLTVASGAVVTVPSGSRWMVL